MKMTLKEARDCFDNRHPCKDCKFNNQGEFECLREARNIAVSALNYLMVGEKLAREAEEKER